MDEIRLTSPLKGKLIALSEVKDTAFADGSMGRGGAVQDPEGKVCWQVLQRGACSMQKNRVPNKSINPTAGYGLPRFRISAPAAAGYLQR